MSLKKELDVVAALIKKDGKVLLCQRREKDAFPLLWEFPGGGVEEKETGAEALEREIKEELDMDIEVGSLVGEFEDETDYLRIKVRLFEILNFKGEILCRECNCFDFFELKDAERLSLAPVDRKIFNYLKNRYNEFRL